MTWPPTGTRRRLSGPFSRVDRLHQTQYESNARPKSWSRLLPLYTLPPKIIPSLTAGLTPTCRVCGVFFPWPDLCFDIILNNVYSDGNIVVLVSGLGWEQEQCILLELNAVSTKVISVYWTSICLRLFIVSVNNCRRTVMFDIKCVGRSAADVNAIKMIRYEICMRCLSRHTHTHDPLWHIVTITLSRTKARLIQKYNLSPCFVVIFSSSVVLCIKPCSTFSRSCSNIKGPSESPRTGGVQKRY